MYRAWHQSGPVTWDKTLAAGASQYAQQLARAGCELQHSSGNYGENLYMTASYPKPDNNCTRGIQAWYSEVSGYNFNTPTPFTTNWRPDNMIGHFTQLVWRGSTRMGCGVGYAPRTYGDKWVGGCKVVCCRYVSGGNIAADSYFANNVFPRV